MELCVKLVLPLCNLHNYLQLAFAGVAPRPKRLGRDVKYRSETQLSGSLEAAALMPWAQVRRGRKGGEGGQLEGVG